MANLTIDQLKAERDKLRDVVKQLDTENNSALDAGTISLNEHSRIFNLEQLLRNSVSQLNIDLLNATVKSITVPDDSPGAQIEASTSKLNAAIDDIQNLRNLLNTVATVITSINSIIGFLATTIPGL